MEAENYLAGGYGIRLAFERQTSGWAPLSKLARTWQPSRLKGIQVAASYGTPFLAATQVFDLRPVPRKWLAIERTDNAGDRFVQKGTIMVTCSGSVGRGTLAHQAHEGVLISHDLLRVTPLESDWWGWVYAFLRSPQCRAMMNASRYGHIIKHLEVSHLDALPIPLLREELRVRFQESANAVLQSRCRAYELTSEAERLYADCFKDKATQTASSMWFATKASAMLGGRRRLDAACHVPRVRDILATFNRSAESVVPLSEVTKRVFVPGRFKHVYGDGGTPYLDSAEILEVNPDVAKRVLSLTPKEQQDYRVEAGWLLMPCSGQVYGNIGHTILATEWHTGKVLSNHILRVCPNDEIRSGYLQCVLGHPLLGRPQLVRFAFGSSVPEIAPGDVSTVIVPRLALRVENELADLVEEAANARDAADIAEQELGQQAETLVDAFLAGERQQFVKAP